MNDINAFPYFGKAKDETGRTIEYFDLGMTLRDYFAAQALIGLLSNHDVVETLATTASKNNERAAPLMSETAYEFADAMLKAREE